MKKKIGIPRALLNHKFSPMWETFFSILGLEVCFSPMTTRKILEDGIRHTVDEACLPVKVFSGHVIYLRDKVDYIFVPRMASIEKGNFICAKFLGLPDVIRNCIPDIPPVIMVDVDLNRKSWRRSMYELGWNWTRNPVLLERAYRESQKAQKDFDGKQGKHISSVGVGFIRPAIFGLDESSPYKNKIPVGLNIGLIAHSYNIYDTYANMDLVKKLEALGAAVITPDMLPAEVIRREGRRFSREVYWTYGREIVGAASYLAGGKADGLILLTSFGCGPDSLLSELIVRRLKDKVPVMSLVFDEETGEAGLMTRLESFIDMVKRSK